ncbi:class I SAM-dependent methyltransferase [Marinobacter orientalis]|uniref:Class I SAM-dependent methyltransferase n=1 Tax=Marinobacter orientalis TaxID=1928859 RepID=A0A7Y0RCH1_9GAMM|nr:class I SAM-dependent methyltransferase [Marinobacter orientalis]NMT63705.1 class I SAM-dependent methyltransferase [Marinobacter orientalis]TGX49819.1 SAM-dependent methyltransferase [Marinobacter orientalis]
MSPTGEVDYSARHDSFESWFRTPLGQALFADQRACVEHHASKLSGARQLQVGLSHRFPLATATDFAQRILTTPTWNPEIPDGVAVCDADELPFPGDSIDLVILHHTADFSPHPHQALREASRVLRGEGVVLLLGFNPFSLWGLRKLISRHNGGPWGGRFMFKRRMEDWLRLLDFTVESTGSSFFQVPLQGAVLNDRAGMMERLCGNRLLPVGAYYCILAKKRVYSGIRRKPVWQNSKVISLPGRGTVGASRIHPGKGRSGNRAVLNHKHVEEC